VRCRRPGWRVAAEALLFVGTGFGMIVVTVATSIFDYRYSVPAALFIPIGIALALHRIATAGGRVPALEPAAAGIPGPATKPTTERIPDPATAFQPATASKSAATAPATATVADPVSEPAVPEPGAEPVIDPVSEPSGSVV